MELKNHPLLSMCLPIGPFPGSPGPVVAFPVFSPFNARPNPLVEIINGQLYRKIYYTDDTCIAQAFVHIALGGAAKDDKKDNKHY